MLTDCGVVIEGRGLMALRKLYRERVTYFLGLMETQDEISGALFTERVKNFTTGLWRQTKPLLMTAPAWTNRMMLDGFEGLGLRVRPKPQDPPELTAAQKKLAEQKARQRAVKNAKAGKKKKPPTGLSKGPADRKGKPLTGDEVLRFLEQLNGRLQATKPNSQKVVAASSLGNMNANANRPGTAGLPSAGAGADAGGGSAKERAQSAPGVRAVKSSVF